MSRTLSNMPGAGASAIEPTDVDARCQTRYDPPWPRTERPLRVLLIGWAWLAMQGRQGSGYNLNASELARGLVLSGHEVTYLQSGMGYRVGVMGGPGKPRIEHREDWAGIRCYELLNSPNLSPSAWNFGNVEKEIAEPTTSRMICAWAKAQRIDVVHIHSQEGYGLDLIGALKRAGLAVVVTLHNYWFACPQVDLLYQEREVCADYEGGQRCERCLEHQPIGRLQRTKAVGASLEYLLGLYRADVFRKLCYGVMPTLKSALRGEFLARFRPRHDTPDRLTDVELARGFDVGPLFGDVSGNVQALNGEQGHESAAGGRTRCDHLILHGYTLQEHEQPKDYARAPMDLNERMVDPKNVRMHLNVLNRYGTRRQAGIEALNQADVVTTPSDYLRRVHVGMGVREERTRRVLLGMPHFDQIHRAAKRSPFYDVRPWNAATATTPLRFCFMGTTRPNKGLEVLARAIELLDPQLRAKCHITIHASGSDWAFRRRLSVYPQVSVYGGYDQLQLIAKRDEFDVGILPHIWLENSPLVLLEFLHAGKFVISSRLGGPVDWIREPMDGERERGVLGNGLLFAGGDEHGLAACMSRCIRGDVVIPSAREVHEASLSQLQSYPGHVREVDELYQSVVRAASGARS